ncbi:MAG: S-methyl-5'-thioinosine phosphorylase [Pseudomonadota bacterium]|nr:S-methyl-5'-thioinosine phosphorylase [Pseudomonadota bacterium]
MIGIIGGTGLYALEGLVECAREQLDTPYGQPSAPYVISELAGQRIAFLARHGEQHEFAPHTVNYRANIAGFQALGVTQIVAVNAVGGIGEHYGSGVIAAAHDIIDYTYGREQSFFDGKANPLKHIDFTYPFSDALRQELLAAARSVGLAIRDLAVLGCTQGPRLETAAEVRKLKRDGCDVVGMTTMPEAALARELDIDYASLCLVVNPAAGEVEEIITMEQIQAVIDQGMGDIKTLLRAFILQRT